MSSGYIYVKKSSALQGEVRVSGAKNAALVIIASLLLTSGKSVLRNVPALSDVDQMIGILQSLGVQVFFDKEKNILEVNTTTLQHNEIAQDCVKKFRASLLVLGPLLARFKKVSLAFPGGDEIGMRPIDYHLKNFKKMGATVIEKDSCLHVAAQALQNQKIVLDYPSVGATENLLMALTLTPGRSYIINAALEPEVLDLIDVLKKMGAEIAVIAPATIQVDGVHKLYTVEHTIIPDRLEAGSLLIAGSVTKGDLHLIDAYVDHMDLFLMKLEEMGNQIIASKDKKNIRIIGAKQPQAVSIKTAPYPGFATDLQPLMMVAQAVSVGSCDVIETVFENRFLHVAELNKMGANIQASGHFAKVHGVKELFGAHAMATDIRAACALGLAGLIAHGQTFIEGLHHWKRGYETLDEKLRNVGAHIELRNDEMVPSNLGEVKKQTVLQK